MARISLGSVYEVARWRGNAVKGRKPSGGYEPVNAHKWSKLIAINMPVWSMSAFAHLGSTPGRELNELAGLWYRVVSLAANTPVPGYLVRPDSLRGLVPLLDEELCDIFGLGLPDWMRMAKLFRERLGLLLLRCDVAVDVGDELLPPPAVEVQHELFLAAAACQISDTAHNGTERNITARHEHGTERNGLSPPRGAAAAAAGAVDRPGGGEQIPPAAPPVCPKSADQLTEAHKAHAALFGAVSKGEQAAALSAWVAMLQALLTAGDATAQDRRDWMKAFTRIWNRTCGPAGSGGPAECCRILDGLALRAKETGLDPTTRNAVAAFNGSLVRAGWRDAGGRGRRAKV